MVMEHSQQIKTHAIMDFPPMPLLPISSPLTIDACKSMPLRSSDIFICSYPKSGTTWTQHIVLTLLLAEKRYRSLIDAKASDEATSSNLDYNHVSDFAPFFEIDAHWDHKENSLTQSVVQNHNNLNRRVFNTHLRWEMLPKSAQHDRRTSSVVSDTYKRPSCGKFIYVTRNLLDVCASFYHHLSNQKEGTYEHDFATFFRDWMNGIIAFGSPLHHLLSFAEGFSDNHYACDQASYTNKDCPMLLLSYEKMKTNLREEVLRTMEFLSLTNIPMDVLDNEILPTFEFQSMKDHIDRFQPKSVTWLNGFQFLRRGESGDGKSLLANTIESFDGNKLCLLEEYHKWVHEEGYKEKVNRVFRSINSEAEDELKQIREVFINVVSHSQ